MREVENVEEVAEALAGMRRIGVDGTDGVGKSTLSKRLGEMIGVPVFALDDFLEKEQGGFVEHIKYDELRASLADEGRLLIEGVCLREVLSRAAISVDAFVYVKRYHLDVWSDECELDIDEPLEQFIKRERDLCSRLVGEKLKSFGLGEEIIRYHFQYRPFRDAHVIYRWNDT